ncbi:MAG: hypothetical protein HRT89_22515, partial [Lentisphaeria bacterium]|nr:hypothetical protein [Lentisphaeria bacterium]
RLKKITRLPPVVRGNKNVVKFDSSKFAAEVAVDNDKLWKPAFTLGPWGEFASEGDKRIYKGILSRKAPRSLPDYMQDYYNEIGEGTLYDPPLYVKQLDGGPYWLHFGTVRSPFQPFNDDIGEMKGSKNPEDPEDPEGPEGPEGPEDPEDSEDPSVMPLVSLVRLYKINKKSFPIMLWSVTRDNPEDKKTWSSEFKVTVKNKKKSYYVKIGKRIGNSDWNLKDVIHERKVVKKGGVEFKEDFYTAIISDGDVKRKLEKRQKLAVDDDDATYTLKFYPEKKYKVLESGDSLRLKWDGRTEVWKFSYTNGKATLKKGDEIVVVKKYSSKIYRKWKKLQEKAAPKRRKPTDQDMGIPTRPGAKPRKGMPPGMPDHPGMQVPNRPGI